MSGGHLRATEGHETYGRMADAVRSSALERSHRFALSIKTCSGSAQRQSMAEFKGRRTTPPGERHGHMQVSCLLKLDAVDGFSEGPSKPWSCDVHACDSRAAASRWLTLVHIPWNHEDDRCPSPLGVVDGNHKAVGTILRMVVPETFPIRFRDDSTQPDPERCERRLPAIGVSIQP